MKPTTPYRKLSKKKQREIDAARRGSWGEISPVTRRPENPRAYNRRKAQRWEKNPPVEPFLCLVNRACSRVKGDSYTRQISDILFTSKKS